MLELELPWDRQPDAIAPSGGSPICKDLRILLTQGVNHVNGEIASLVGNVGTTVTSRGPAHARTASAGNYLRIKSNCKATTTDQLANNCTVLLLTKGAASAVVGKTTGSGNGLSLVGAHQGQWDDRTYLAGHRYSPGGYGAGLYGADSEVPHCFALRSDISDPGWHVNGKKVTTAYSIGSYGDWDPALTDISIQQSLQGFGSMTDTILFALWERNLSDAEIAAATLNPWQLFAPRRLPLFFAASSGSSTTIDCGVGSATAQGHQAGIAAHTVVAAGVGEAAASGHAAGIALRTVVAAGIGEAVASGLQADITSRLAIAAGVGEATATGHQATITIGSGITVACGTGEATAQGHQAQISAGTQIACGVGGATASGHTADIALRTVISGGVAQATADGLAAGIVLRTTISAGVGSASASGHAATITVASGGSADDVWGYVLANGKTANETVTEIHAMLTTLLGACPDKLTLIEKLLRNKRITDPVAGTQTVFDNDGSTVLAQGALFEDAAGTQPYRVQGAERAERLA